jgi:uncharacterized protein (TIGR02646 family)
MDTAKKRVIKRSMLEKQNSRCAYCHKKLTIEQATIDHIVPRSNGGKGLWNNLCIACRPCNVKKGAMAPHVWHGLLMQGLVA